jgi:FixJ family two-component response regulator
MIYIVDDDQSVRTNLAPAIAQPDFYLRIGGGSVIAFKQ